MSTKTATQAIKPFNPQEDPFDAVEWSRRDSKIVSYSDQSVVHFQKGVEAPDFWSQGALNILSQKYLREIDGVKESSVKDAVNRIVGAIVEAARAGGYFKTDAELMEFGNHLRYLMVTQKVSFNSPVWFNIGCPGVAQQASACFILHVEDSMDAVLNWYREEGTIFTRGSGSGVNLSGIRSSVERLKGGGLASGPVSFMRGADASAGTIKSGGTTRRAAKMVILDIGHPDIEEFIWCKSREEKKARDLEALGYDMGLNGLDSISIQYQNANNSVRVTKEFLDAYEADEDWNLTAVTTGEVIKTVRARDLMRQIATAAWECADPGIQFDTTINHWHTSPAHGRINGSNPCSEYMHIDNSSCNLASLNLMRFLTDDNQFDVAEFQGAIRTTFTAQEILISFADFPTDPIRDNTHAHRQLGLGYANLGALLMALGMAYDSDEGRKLAASITSLMTGTAYLCSTEMAAQVGPCTGYLEGNQDAMDRVLRQHREASNHLTQGEVLPEMAQKIGAAANRAWGNAVTACKLNGIRNMQASVLAPTGTIGLQMDCDTTGIEPDFALVKSKLLVGGGTMQIVNQQVPRALRFLGYAEEGIQEVEAYLLEHSTLHGNTTIRDEHLPIFATAVGDNSISWMGHVGMMAAVQPFLSGAISKTVNMPETATVEEIELAYVTAGELGVKALAIYRDNCKVGQPLSSGAAKAVEQLKSVSPEDALSVLLSESPQLNDVLERMYAKPVQNRVPLPSSRSSQTFSFRVGEAKGYVTVGHYPDGRVGELFLKMAKQGSTLSGVMDGLALAISFGLQHGVHLSEFVKAYTNTRFEPSGMTNDPDVRMASSILDYIFKRLAIDYLPMSERQELGIQTMAERAGQEHIERVVPGRPSVVHHAPSNVQSAAIPATVMSNSHRIHDVQHDVKSDAPYCMQCGIQMQRAGSCHACPSCGSTSGCS